LICHSLPAQTAVGRQLQHVRRLPQQRQRLMTAWSVSRATITVLTAATASVAGITYRKICQWPRTSGQSSDCSQVIRPMRTASYWLPLTLQDAIDPGVDRQLGPAFSTADAKCQRRSRRLRQ
jgi:hypothetical protein